MFELMLRPHDAERRPWMIAAVSFLFSFSAYVISLYLFPENFGIASVFMTSMFLLPLFHLLLIREEKMEEHKKDELGIVLELFWLMFLGVTINYALLPVVGFPAPSEQAREISAVTGHLTIPEIGQKIITNNLKVLFITYMFSLFFGATSIFILVWNASIVGTWLATIFVPKQGFLAGVFTGLLSISLHGLPEITAYFLAAIAGGLLSVAVKRRKTEEMAVHSLVLFGISLVLILIAGIIEAYA